MDGLITHYVILDSATRDRTRFPDPNTYVQRLPKVLRDVESVEIMTLQVPRGESNVHTGNHRMDVQLEGSTTSVNVPVGQYTTAADLVAALQSALQTVDPLFEVTHDNIPARIKLRHPTSPFTLILRGSMPRLLGFATTRLEVTEPNQSLRSSQPMDLSAEPYALLYLNDYERYESSSDVLSRAFCIVPFEEKPWRARMLLGGQELEKKGLFLLNRSHRNVSDFTIRFLRPDGSPYDFMGMDHQIVLRVIARGKRSD